MVTVHRQSGLRFAIYTDDHEPAHVHILGDGEMKVVICGASGLPDLIDTERMKRGDIRKAMRIVTELQDYFMERWREIHD
jgi:hypothetical protein